jgi:peptidoglycan hydrolase FlgJ
VNVDPLNAQASASLLLAQTAGAPGQPTSAQLQTDRNAIAQQESISGRNTTRKAATPEEVKKAASQFEAIIMRQLLAPTIEPIMSAGVGGAKDAGGGIYGYMLTDVLATGLSQGGGLGWAKMLEKQLSSTHRGADIKPNTPSQPSTDLSPL